MKNIRINRKKIKKLNYVLVPVAMTFVMMTTGCSMKNNDTSNFDMYSGYYNENTNTDKSGRLLKTKDVIKEYPYLTIYALDKAVKDKKLPVTKIGNTNYFNTDDIEAFINIGKKDIND